MYHLPPYDFTCSLFCLLAVDEIHSHPEVFLNQGPAPGGAAFSSCVNETEKAMKQEVGDDSKHSGCRENKLILTIANSECVGRRTLLTNLNTSTLTQEHLCEDLKQIWSLIQSVFTVRPNLICISCCLTCKGGLDLSICTHQLALLYHRAATNQGG